MLTPYAPWSMSASSQMNDPRQTRRISIKDIKMEDVPILSQRPSEEEIKTFQEWIRALGRTVGVRWNRPYNRLISNILFDDVQNAFYADINVEDLVKVFVSYPEEHDEIALTEPRLRKKRRLA